MFMELVKPKMKLNHNYSKLEAVLLRCRERGIALNKNKLKLWIT